MAAGGGGVGGVACSIRDNVISLLQQGMLEGEADGAGKLVKCGGSGELVIFVGEEGWECLHKFSDNLGTLGGVGLPCHLLHVDLQEASASRLGGGGQLCLWLGGGIGGGCWWEARVAGSGAVLLCDGVGGPCGRCLGGCSLGVGCLLWGRALLLLWPLLPGGCAAGMLVPTGCRCGCRPPASLPALVLLLLPWLLLWCALALLLGGEPVDLHRGGGGVYIHGHDSGGTG